MSKSNKGSRFEREICKLLSCWWSKEICNKQRDDIFWRTSISGGRATIRAKKGKETFGSQGDVTAIDPIGCPLLKVFTIELKRGYSNLSITDLITKQKSKLLDFIQQAKKQKELTKTPFWLLILKQDHQLPLAFIPFSFFEKLHQKEDTVQLRVPCLLVLFDNNMVVVTKLETLLAFINPKDIIKIANEINQEEGTSSNTAN